MNSPSGDDADASPSKRPLPPDLPKTLDDRYSPSFPQETEIYDAWAGQSQLITSPVPAKALNFNLSLGDGSYAEEDLAIRQLQADEENILQMASQAVRSGGNPYADTEAEDAILEDADLSKEEKKAQLQALFSMATSNGQLGRVRSLLRPATMEFIDINAPDSEGTTPLIYASCFGHEEVVKELVDAGADVDKQDKNGWNPLMWAMTNAHKGISRILLDHGADPDIKSSTGRTLRDFVPPEVSEYLHESGYNIGNVGVTDDFYNAGMGEDRFEEELAENELRRRMMMESAINLEVDLTNVGLDEHLSPDDSDDSQEFLWDRCLSDQMFVFQETELGRILDIIITNMTPQRSPSQRPVPANVLFLCARYAHYHHSRDLLEKLLNTGLNKINDVVEKHQWDMTILAFWISNCTLLLFYLTKDVGLRSQSLPFQEQLSDLINDVFLLIIRDAERRMDKHLDAAVLDHETIPGLDVTFQSEWKIFKMKPKPKAPEPYEKRFRPPSPKQRMKPSPRNITSLLSSTLFVLDLYDVHSVITTQVISQLLYWIAAEIFNRIILNQKYLARTKAMQIRLNVSVLEDWARSNNRQPEHFENGSMTSTGENTVDAARRHLAPVIQLLQWLQCLSSIGEDFESLVGTVQQLKRLSPQQLLHVVRHYRAEVGETKLPKSALKYLQTLDSELVERRKHRRNASSSSNNVQSGGKDSAPMTPNKEADADQKSVTTPKSPPSPLPPNAYDGEDDTPPHLLIDPAHMLPFRLPTSTDMLVGYGAGFGGVNKDRERKYIPTVPPEFLARFEEPGGSKLTAAKYDESSWA